MKTKNKYLIILFSFALIVLLAVFILNLRVSYYQGINYQVRLVNIPLYLKIIDLFSRHYHYKELTREIASGSKTDEDKAFKLFTWTHSNIKDIPDGFPVVDDHVWHIIVRGYGARDQFQDVFTTLCNYAGLEAFFCLLHKKDHSSKIPISFVRLDRKWRVFDPYCGIYFKNREGDIASIDDIKNGNWVAVAIAEAKDFDYKDFFNNLPTVNEIGLNRANIQSPLNRLLFEIKKMKNDLFDYK